MMQYGSVPGITKPISRLVQGTIMVSSKELDRSFQLLDDVYELGCNTFDTANVYGGGDNERTVGKWVNSRGIREKVVMIGKGAHPMRGVKRVTPGDISADVAESLDRFQFDYIDLYLLHRDDPEVPVGPIIEVLNEHLREGRIRAFGGSNWSHKRLQEANDYAAAHGLTPFAASSPNYSLARQHVAPWDGCISISYDEDALEYYRKTQIPVFAWSSLAGGFWSGRFRRDNLNTFTEDLDVLAVKSYCKDDNFQRLDRAEEVAKETGMTIPQIAMAYIMSQPLNLFALVGCNTKAEFQANLDALATKFPQEKSDWLALA